MALQRMKNLRIMLIDDSVSDRYLFKQILSAIDKNIEYVYAPDGESAVSYFNSVSFDIPDFIFLDVNMPKMDGMMCLKELKKIKSIELVPVYMYSTAHPDMYSAAAKTIGATDCIQKEYDLDNSIKTISSILQKSEHFTLGAK